MYFANNTPTQNFCDTVTQRFALRSREVSKLHMHALVDAAFDESGFALAAPNFQHPAWPVYAHTAYSGAQEAGPHIVEIDTSSAQTTRTDINHLLNLCTHRPMFSLWVTELEGAQLVAQWQPFVSAHMEGGSAYMLRFADTRVLHSLLGVLTPQQRAHFMPGNTQIWMPARGGQFISASNDGVEPISPMTQLRLDKTQFNTLMENAEADAVIDQLIDKKPHAFAHISGAELHRFVTHQIARSNTHHISQTPDRVMYCDLAWQLGADFDKDEELAVALMEMTPHKRLPNVLQRVSSQAWARLQAQQQRTQTERHA